MFSLQRLFFQISEQRKLIELQSDIELSIDSFWTSIFKDYILLNSKANDDLIFYVNKIERPKIDVFRRNGLKGMAQFKETAINWEETVYLNLVLQQFEYTLTCSICIRSGPQDLQILRRHSHSVYPSPSKHRMDIKDEKEFYTYPNLFFAVDNYDEVYKDFTLRDEEIICVELVGHDKDRNIEGVLFMGAVKYPILKKAHQNKSCPKGLVSQLLPPKKANRKKSMTRSVNAEPAYDNAIDPHASPSGRLKDLDTDFFLVNYNKVQYLKLRGPDGLGQAEMAVSFTTQAQQISVKHSSKSHINDQQSRNSYCSQNNYNNLTKQSSTKYRSASVGKQRKFSNLFINSAPATPGLQSPDFDQHHLPSGCEDTIRNRDRANHVTESTDGTVCEGVTIRKRLSGSLLGLRKLLLGNGNGKSSFANVSKEILATNKPNIALPYGHTVSHPNESTALAKRFPFGPISATQKSATLPRRRRCFSQSYEEVESHDNQHINAINSNESRDTSHNMLHYDGSQVMNDLVVRDELASSFSALNSSDVDVSPKDSYYNASTNAAIIFNPANQLHQHDKCNSLPYGDENHLESYDAEVNDPMGEDLSGTNDFAQNNIIDAMDECDTLSVPPQLFIKAQVTYIAIPLRSIVESLFRTQQKPILTF